MSDQKKEKPAPPAIPPYALPIVLAAMGVWCFYDGWLTSNPDMQEHLMFNRISSAVLLIGALVSFIRLRRAEKEDAQEIETKIGDE